jgi:hypothetical protein
MPSNNALMRAIAAFFTIATFSTTAVALPSDPSEVPALEVAAFKAGISAGCRDTGRKRGDPPQQVDRLCACIFAKLDASLGPEGWKSATFHAQRQQFQELKRLIDPPMASAKECRVEGAPGA